MVLFSATIFVHEFGHFLVARKLGMVVDVFSIGFGPAIWKKKHKGVTYKISMIPLGGYVALPQLDPAAMSGVQGKNKGEGQSEGGNEEQERVLPPVSPWSKILVSLAGSMGNIVFAIIFALIIYANPGSVTGSETTRIGSVATNSLAYQKGIRPGDRINAVNGTEVNSWYRFQEETVLGVGKDGEVTVTLESGGSVREVRVPVATNELAAGVIPGIETARQCAVTNVAGGGSAARAGLREGDVIEAVDGNEVVSCQHLQHVTEGRDGETAQVTVRRGEEELILHLELPIEGTAPKGKCLIGGIIGGTSADKAGLKAGDVIIELAGVPIVNWRQFIEKVNEHKGETLPIVVLRGDDLVETEVTPEYDEERERALIGIVLGVRPTLPWMRYRSPARQLTNDALAIVRVLSALVNPSSSGNAAKAIGGPLMIIMTLWASIKISVLNAVGFLRFLNINLAVLNLLPIPVLDGGHIMFSLWEGITKKRINPRFINILVNIFMVLLLGLFLLITFRDIERGFRSGKEVKKEERQADGEKSGDGE